MSRRLMISTRCVLVLGVGLLWTACEARAALRAANHQALLAPADHVCYFPPSWVRRYHDAGSDEAGVTQAGYGNAVAADADGNVYVAGATYSTNFNGDDLTTIKYDSQGRQEWLARWHGLNVYAEDEATHIALDPSGNVYVGGNSHDPSGSALTVLKYSTNGSLLWSRRYTNGCGTNAGAVAYGMFADSDGSVYLGGNVGVVKWNADGILCWELCELNAGAKLEPLCSGLGFYWARKIKTTAGSNTTILLDKVDTNGTVVWSANYAGGIVNDLEGMAVDSEDAVYLACVVDYAFLQGHGDFVIIKYDAHGHRLWVRTYDGPAHGSDRPRDIAVNDTGDVYVTGNSWTQSRLPVDATDQDGFDILTVKYDREGQLLRAATFNGPANSEDRARRVVVDSDGYPYIAGDIRAASDPEEGFDVVVLKYDAELNLIWTMRYDGPIHGSETVADLALDPKGDLLLTGASQMLIGSGIKGTELLAMKLGQHEPRLAVCGTGLLGGLFHGAFVCEMGGAYDLEWSTNLVHWMLLRSVVNPNGFMTFSDEESANVPQRFYRAMKPAP